MQGGAEVGAAVIESASVLSYGFRRSHRQLREDLTVRLYPRRKPPHFHEATFLANYFDTIELNVTFYCPVPAHTAAEWIERVSQNPDFLFTAKLWREFTHTRDLRADNETTPRPAMETLRDAGKLGALLAQFPWSFKNTKETIAYLDKLIGRFRDFPLVIEVRHSSWDKPEFYSWLAERNVGFCNIDQPIIGRSLKPGEKTTSPVGYVRLHGRNYNEWFRERPDGNASAIYTILNNHPDAKALVNAFQIIHGLTGKKLDVPEDMVGRYPILETIASSRPKAGFLF
ncbi:MAG: hypothetical protein JWO71_3441 [Candidatus Acidoferrum typicum]|nr:hypothetical protein [Candidatus Acidoferrum typicum]